jgi:hypothetical protein
MHVLIAAESDNLVIPAGARERRYVVLNLATDHVQDRTYFTALFHQMKNGGYEAMLYDLLHREIGNWHPRQIIRTAGIVDQQSRNLSPIDAWWIELLEAGVLPGGGPKEPNVAPSGDWTDEACGGSVGANGDIDFSSFTFGQKPQIQPGLYTSARKSSPELKNASDHSLGAELRARGCTHVGRVAMERGRANGWKFPLLRKCREDWEALHPGWPWPEIKKETPENRLHAIQSTWWANP